MMGSREDRLSTPSASLATAHLSVSPQGHTVPSPAISARTTNPGPSPPDTSRPSASTVPATQDDTPTRHRTVRRLPNGTSPDPRTAPALTTASTTANSTAVARASPIPARSAVTCRASVPNSASPHTLPDRATSDGDPTSAVSPASHTASILAPTPPACPSRGAPGSGRAGSVAISGRLERVPPVHTAQPRPDRSPLDVPTTHAHQAPSAVNAAQAQSSTLTDRLAMTRNLDRINAETATSTATPPRLLSAGVFPPTSGVPTVACQEQDEASRAYVKSVHIPELFDDLAGDILHERPDDMVEFMLAWLIARRQALGNE